MEREAVRIQQIEGLEDIVLERNDEPEQFEHQSQEVEELEGHDECLHFVLCCGFGVCWWRRKVQVV
jgi:hypothetical protein